MTRPTVPPAQIAATAMVPPQAGSGPLSPAQLQSARVRMALEQLAALVEDLEASPPGRSARPRGPRWRRWSGCRLAWRVSWCLRRRAALFAAL